MACQWQDEQTGGHCPELVRKFTGTNQKWFTFTNGAHIDSLDPDTFNRWYDFLQLFVARRSADRRTSAIPRAAAPVIYQAGDGPPADRRGHAARRPDPADPDVRRGARRVRAAAAGPGAVRQRRRQVAARQQLEPPATRIAGYAQNFSSFPVPGHHRAHLVLRARRHAQRHGRRRAAGINSFTANANALPRTDYGTNTGAGGLWGNASQWEWKLAAEPGGHRRSRTSRRRSPRTPPSSVAAPCHLWVRSSTPDVDLQATISEVRPDGNETFVQNGWIRASERKLSTDSNNMFKRPSTTLEPIPTFKAADAAPMPAGQFVKVVVPLYYQGHAYRTGSRIRVTIAAPNGTQPIWSFGQTKPQGTADRLDRVLRGHAVEPRPPGRARRDRADTAAAVPEPAQPAVPALRATLSCWVG